MAAYNWIRVSERCPACLAQATIRVQTHVASSHNGDDRGRFCHREYVLGESMHWWPAADPRFEGWRDEGLPSADSSGAVEEACYADCLACGTEICAVLRFRDVAPVACIEVRHVSDWPREFPR